MSFCVHFFLLHDMLLTFGPIHNPFRENLLLAQYFQIPAKVLGTSAFQALQAVLTQISPKNEKSQIWTKMRKYATLSTFFDFFVDNLPKHPIFFLNPGGKLQQALFCL